jgi:hypothetical protein
MKDKKIPYRVLGECINEDGRAQGKVGDGGMSREPPGFPSLRPEERQVTGPLPDREGQQLQETGVLPPPRVW